MPVALNEKSRRTWRNLKAKLDPETSSSDPVALSCTAWQAARTGKRGLGKKG